MNEGSGTVFAHVDHDFNSLFGAPNETGSPERRLLLAILERAILDYVGNDAREVAEAQEWLFDDETAAGRSYFSFKWICEQLDLDHPSIAEKIRAMPRRGNRKVAPWYFSKAPAAA
jgi:hypothetical protein